MKNKSTATILAFFLGGLGIHRFYLGQNGKGILYLLFFWTLIPAFIGFIDFILFIVMSEEEFNKKYNDGAAFKASKQPNKAILVGAVIFALIAFGGIVSVIGTSSAISDGLDITASGDSASKVEIIETSFGKDAIGMDVVYATVKNNSSKLLSMLSIKAVHYNADGKVVGSAVGNALNIPSGETKVIECPTMDLNGSVKYDVQVEAALFE